MNNIKNLVKTSLAVIALFGVTTAFAQSHSNEVKSADDTSKNPPKSAHDILVKQWPLGTHFRVVDVSGDGGTFCSFQKDHIVSMSLDAGGDLTVDPIDPAQAKIPVYGEEGQVGNLTGTTLYMEKVTKRHVPRDVDWDTRDYTLDSKVTNDTIVNEIANKNFLVFRKWGTKTVLKKNADGSIDVSVDRKLVGSGSGKKKFKETCRLEPVS